MHFGTEKKSLGLGDNVVLKCVLLTSFACIDSEDVMMMMIKTGCLAR